MSRFIRYQCMVSRTDYAGPGRALAGRIGRTGWAEGSRFAVAVDRGVPKRMGLYSGFGGYMQSARWLLIIIAIVPLLNCGGSQHGVEEKYYLVSTNIKVPYWQQAFAGLNRAGTQLQVKTEQVGPDTYDPKA